MQKQIKLQVVVNVSGTEMETPDGEGLVLGAREGGVTPEVRTCPWKGTGKVLEGWGAWPLRGTERTCWRNPWEARVGLGPHRGLWPPLSPVFCEPVRCWFNSPESQL